MNRGTRTASPPPAETLPPTQATQEPLPATPTGGDAAEQPPIQPTTPTVEKIPCSCARTPCHGVFKRSDISDWVLQYLELEKAELNLVLLAKISCGIHLDVTTRNTKHSKQSERKSSRTDYLHHGHKICRDFFLYLHSIGKDKLTALLKYYKAQGVQAVVHMNSKRKPKHALTFDFINNYAEVHAIRLPGRTPSHWVCDNCLLPTDCTKRKVFDEYKAAAGQGAVALRTFRHLWQSLMPFIRTMPPATDLCFVCQQGVKNLNRPNTANLQQALDELNLHRTRARQERAHYTALCQRIASQLKEGNQEENHLSFDYAQQVHYPNDPQQPGPIYFKTPRKCGIFGVNSEGQQRQINYLIDEAHTCGKGANAVISLLHDYLTNFSVGERILHLHADNCVGQNKNNARIHYLLWRCLKGLNSEIHLSFLLTGHTKFSPDAGFGLLKRTFRRTEVNCLADIAKVVNESAAMNEARLVGNENGETTVPTFDWTQFSNNFKFKNVKNIKRYHHFIIDGTGSIKLKEYIDSVEETQNIGSPNINPNLLPQVIKPKGLDAKRKWYLYKQIREFVAPYAKDIVCPLPSEPLIPESDESDSDESDTEERPPAKVQRAMKPGSSRGAGAKASRGKSRGKK